MIIDFHAHYFPQPFLDSLERGKTRVWTVTDAQGNLRIQTESFDNLLVSAHYTLSERVEALDRHKVDMQVLTMTIPGVHLEKEAVGIRQARIINDSFAEAIAQYPGRFTGIAVLPLQAPEAAARELERATQELGLRGGTLFSHVNREPLDGEKYRPVFDAATDLDVPLWMHPMIPESIGMMADFGTVVVAGFMHETTVAVSRLVYSGTLERYPTLKLVLSQMGGTVPFLAERMQRGYQVYPSSSAHLSTDPMTLLKRLYVDTTPHTPNAIRYAIEFFGVDKVLMGSDFPHEIGDLPGALETIRQLPLSESDRALVMGENARRLLRLD